MGQIWSSLTADESPVPDNSQRSDILHAGDFSTETHRGSLHGGSSTRARKNSGHVGYRFNEWRKPDPEYSDNDVELRSSQLAGEMELNRKAWARARDAVDYVLDHLLKEIKIIAQRKYAGLKIVRYVRQGSSRDGLKVIVPDEFDTLLEFKLEEMSYSVVNEKKSGKIIPEFCRLKVARSMARLQTKLPELYRKGVFVECDGELYLNAFNMFQVFVSIIDTAVKIVQGEILEIEDEFSGEDVYFKITRRINYPSVNITIHIDDNANQRFMTEGRLRNRQEGIRKIDVDIVPGLLIKLDTVPHPSDPCSGVDCPVYAVIKRVSENDVPFPQIVWRMCSSGYEKHTLDMARYDRKKRYIVTALRILKTYFTTTKTRAQANNQPPPQITTVLRSYFLKHTAFYLILYLCYIYPDVSIEGVEDVLAYFLSFLSVVLEKRCLPHFFHSNDLIRWMYPSYPVIRNKLYFNLLRNKSPDSLLQARRALKFDMIPKVGVSPRSSPIVDEFRDMISGLELF